MSNVYQIIDQHITSEASDTYFVFLDGSMIHTIQDFYKSISTALHFPDYFGENLDALDEMLYDLDWIEHDFVMLVIQHSQSFLKEEPETRKTILKLLEDIDNPYFEVSML